MPFQRAVVKVHLGVQRHKTAPFAQCQRVDLKQGHILFGGKGRQPPHQRGQFLRRDGLQPPALQQVPGLKRPQVVASVQPGREDPLRRESRHSLDVHAAVRRSHDGQALGCPVKSYRQIAFPGARRAPLDPHDIDALTVRPGLGRHQPCAEQGRGGLPCLFRAAAHLHAANLAPAPGMDLRFDHPYRAGQIPCGLLRFSGRGGKPSLRRGYPVCAQEPFRLIFVDMHGSAPCYEWCPVPLFILFPYAQTPLKAPTARIMGNPPPRWTDRCLCSKTRPLGPPKPCGKEGAPSARPCIRDGRRQGQTPPCGHRINRSTVPQARRQDAGPANCPRGVPPGNVPPAPSRSSRCAPLRSASRALRARPRCTKPPNRGVP